MEHGAVVTLALLPNASSRVRGCIIHVFRVGVISVAPAAVVCFLVACVQRSDDLSLSQDAVFNPGQLPSYPAVFTAC